MNDPIGFVLVLFLKLLIVIGINYLLIRWLRKNETTLKIIVCWVLGLYLNLSQVCIVNYKKFSDHYLNLKYRKLKILKNKK